MSSTTRKIAPSEWEHHKDTIVELYRNKPLKDVRAEMQDRHGFDASSWQYEMQLKRWNIRKNATRREWQQYFTANKDQPIANSLGDGPDTNLAPIILSKSTASKKRASRWAAGSIVTPNSVPVHAVLAPRVPDSTSLGNEEHPDVVLSLNEPIIAPRHTQPIFQHASQNTADSLHATGNFSLLNWPYSINNVITHSVLGSSSRVLGTFAEALNTPANPLDFSLTDSVVHGLQQPGHGHVTVDLADFPLMDLPVGSNMGTLMLQDIRQILPFAQLEKSILSRGIMLERPAGHTTLGGFASRVIAGFLSSNDQSMVQQTPDMKRFLRILGAQIPGESSVLITDDQSFETKFARVLLFSVINGFAGLDDIPMEKILRFLNRFLVNKLLLNILEQSPRYVSRTLADNIFRAAIEATDTKVVNLLLNRRLVDVNETVCLHDTEKYTPIERASALRSLNLMRILIDAGADVNKSYANSSGDEMDGALNALVSAFQGIQWPPIPPPIEALSMLVAAGARVHPGIIYKFWGQASQSMEFILIIFNNVPPENHREFFQHKYVYSLAHIAASFDDCDAKRLFQKFISICRQAGCRKCLVDLGVDNLTQIVAYAASAGKLGLVQLLFDESDVRFDLPKVFLAAIRSTKPALIDFILSQDPDLDPPAIDEAPTGNPLYRTPISEAVRCGNEDLIRVLEAGGCLDHLTEGARFRPLVDAAAEAGNAAYMRKLLALAGTSKHSNRVTEGTLALALDRGHQDIAQMLLEAGATSSGLPAFPYRSLYQPTISKHMEMVHALIASGAQGSVQTELAEIDRSIVAVALDEYPGFKLGGVDGLNQFLRKCIEIDTLDWFKEVLQILKPDIYLLNSCLVVAVEFGHNDLIEYLLDMGASPFHDSVLQAAIPDKPDMMRLLLQTERRRQTMPKCIGSRVLEPLMSNGAGNAEALDELIRTGAINFARLEVLYIRERTSGLRKEYYHSNRFTPLGMAIQGVPGRFDSNMVAMRKFLEAGADPDEISIFNENYIKGSPLMTALMVAIETGLEDAVNMLLDHGADVNARPRIRTTRTALQFAAELGNMEMIRLLLSRGADANSSASSRGGATALQFAAMSGNCNMVAELIDHGAQLDTLPSKIDGMWPLEGAAANGRLDMVRYLWELNVRAVATGMFPDGFRERHCLRAMNFACEKGHIGCRDLISELSGISVDRLETDEYGAPWIAY